MRYIIIAIRPKVIKKLEIIFLELDESALLKLNFLRSNFDEIIYVILEMDEK